MTMPEVRILEVCKGERSPERTGASVWIEVHFGERVLTIRADERSLYSDDKFPVFLASDRADDPGPYHRTEFTYV